MKTKIAAKEGPFVTMTLDTDTLGAHWNCCQFESKQFVTFWHKYTTNQKFGVGNNL